MRVLTVNAGSSSLKLRVIDRVADPGTSDSRAVPPRWPAPADRTVTERLTAVQPAVADEVVASRDDGDIEAVVDDAGGPLAIDAIAHRVVHGGDRFTAAAVIDDDVLEAIEALTPLAPLHQPAALQAIGQAAEALPGVPAVACFDTAFHTTIPPAASTYALPRAWIERFGLRRYGFHGLSHAWASRRGALLAGYAPDTLRIVTCHLGAGASCCAVVNGRSTDTTMGFTPVEGLVMATRSGSVDPGLVAWLIDAAGLDAGEVAEALDRRSGLAGLTGVAGGDVREVVAAADAGDVRAALAVDVWVHRLRREIAAMAAAAGGLDLLVFTGGIGEHQPRLRKAACDGLSWIGVTLDAGLNATASGDAVVSSPDSAVTVAVVTSREDLQLARESAAALSSGL